MVDFLLGNLYIIVIIAFAIFTAISSRSGKNKSRNGRPGMPTFGGGPDVPGRRTLTPAQTTQDNEQEAQRRYHEAQRQFDREQLDRGTGEGRSLHTGSDEGSSRGEGPYSASDSSEGSRMEQMERTADHYRMEMQERLDQLNQGRAGSGTRMDRMDLSPMQSSSSSDEQRAAASVSELRLDPAQAAQGVLWAEILSPPRSRHSGSFGRKPVQPQPSKEA